MSAARVVILHNKPVLSSDHPDAESEHEILSTVAFVENVLKGAGFDVERLGADGSPGPLFDGLQRLRPDVVFNLYEGTATAGETEALVASALEWLGIPFTGSPSTAITISRQKHIAKTLLFGAGLPTPRFRLVTGSVPGELALGWPVIVKLATEHASVGIDQSSVVTDRPELERRVARLWERYQLPILVEEYVAGREFNVALIENPELRVLPLAEIEFTHDAHSAGEQWPIVTYIAKWKPET